MKSIVACWILCCGLAAAASTAFAQDTPDVAPEPAAERGPSNPMMEMRANRMIESALELLDSKQDERAVKILLSTPRMFPDAQARFRAHLELGRFYSQQRKVDEAVRQFQRVGKAEDPLWRAEALHLTGRTYFNANNYDAAFMALRQVTNDYPWSSFANQAYFLIGQCHFERKRWRKAVEAFRMVGTAVPQREDLEDVTPAEAGQRVFVRVKDKDLPVLSSLGQPLEVMLKALDSGDSETVALAQLGRADEDYLCSVATTTEPSKPEDGRLQVRGGDRITVYYVDQNTADGNRNRELKSSVQLVSTAAMSWMDGAFAERVDGLFLGQPAFLQLKDVDLDTTDEPDTVILPVIARYKQKKREELTLPDGATQESGETLEEEEDVWITRNTARIELLETAPHSGFFRGRLVPEREDSEGAARSGVISVMPGDEIVAEYVDKIHLQGDDPRQVFTSAVVVEGGNVDPRSIVATSADPNTQARKLLIESQLLHDWGEIFKEVGLQSNADGRADEGLNRVEGIMSLYAKHSLDRRIVEEAYATKWDLYLIKNDVDSAIATCQALLTIFPDTALADRAFLRIAQAQMKSGDEKDIKSAMDTLKRVLAIEDSPHRAEAQFRIAEAQEMLATEKGGDLAPAMLAFEACAKTYPDSPFAGESLKRIINYYLNVKDYSRAIQRLQMVEQDYPDAEWLDEMTLKWGIALYRIGDKQGAIRKFRQVVEEYPGGAAAAKATSFLNTLTKK